MQCISSKLVKADRKTHTFTKFMLRRKITEKQLKSMTVKSWAVNKEDKLMKSLY